jgi:pentose-5-phosphate-3-epimerase
VGLANAAELAEAGVTNFVAGTAIFQADNPNCYMDEMRACWRKG